MEHINELFTHYMGIWSGASTEKKNGRGRSSANSSTVYGVEKLREVILSLAMTGKLTFQENDGASAQELIALIRKQREGKIENNIPPESDLPEKNNSRLPASWSWVRFGEIAQHNSGKTLDKGRNQGMPKRYITTSNLYWGRFDLSELREMPIQEGEIEKFSAQQGDLLICEGGDAGRAAVWMGNQPICFQNHIHRARFYGDINPFYIYRFFQKLSVTGEINQYRKGVGISSMSGKSLASILIPLPPIAEQARIVSRLDELMLICDELEDKTISSGAAHCKLVEEFLLTLQSSKNNEEFRNNWKRVSEIFDILFTTSESIDALKDALVELAVIGKLSARVESDSSIDSILERISEEKKEFSINRMTVGGQKPRVTKHDVCELPIPEGWRWVALDQISLFITDGTHYTPTYVPKGVPFISIKDINGSEISFKDCKYIPREEHLEINKRCNPEFGDILLCRIGTLGRPTIVDVSIPFSLFVSVGLIKLPKNVDITRYLHLVLGSPFMVRQYDRIKAGGIHTNKLNLADIPKLLIPLPPIEEQIRILKKVDELVAIAEDLKLRVKHANDLRLTIADTLAHQVLA